MKLTTVLFGLIFFCHCAQTTRPAAVVAAETWERSKPLLQPAGGDYLDFVAVHVIASGQTLEWNYGMGYTLLTQSEIDLTESMQLTVRNRKDPSLMTSETYRIIKEFPLLKLNPPPGAYTTGIAIAVTGQPQNVKIEIGHNGAFTPYVSDTGILVTQNETLELRQCSVTRCSSAQYYHYSVTAASPAVERALSLQEIADFTEAARTQYNQLSDSGLAALMDAAKLRVVQNPSLLNDSLRQRFLSQDNAIAATHACTVVARYLYVKARRLTAAVQNMPEISDFPDYYIHHIAGGDIITDNDGVNFTWVANGVALVMDYLPQSAAAPYSFERGNTHPTDFALLDAVAVQNPQITLLRDGPTATANTHTFVAIKNGADYTMIETYFPTFNNVATRSSAGFPWPYAYRFGPIGSRFLHFAYGY